MATLDHRTIEERSLAERYATGRLAGDELERFEVHLLECRECIERVEAAERLQRGLVDVVAEDAAADGAAVGLLALLASAVRRRPLAWLAAGLVCVVAIGATGAWQWRRAQTLEAWRQPAAGMPVTLLTPLRGSAAEFPVVLPARGSWVGLWIEPGGDDFPGYRATLSDPEGAVAWTGDDLRLNELGAILVQLPAELLRPGAWRLNLEGRLPDGGVAPVATYPLSVRGSP